MILEILKYRLVCDVAAGSAEVARKRDFDFCIDPIHNAFGTKKDRKSIGLAASVSDPECKRKRIGMSNALGRGERNAIN
jgi:hypothetical protein